MSGSSDRPKLHRPAGRSVSMQPAVRAESAWGRFGVLAQSYWLVCKAAIEKMREELGFPMMYGDFEHLCRLLADIDRERGIAAPAQERLRQLMEEEAVRGEEPPPTTTE